MVKFLAVKMSFQNNKQYKIYNDTPINISDIDLKGLNYPVFAFRPHTLNKAADFFLKHFNGTTLYAVKTNPEPHVLTQLCESGIDSFEVASLDEARTIRELFPSAQIYFMHPVKSRQAIKEAYFTYDIKHFSLDTQEELEKILQETDYSKTLNLHIRIAIPNTYSELSLADKFGIGLQQAAMLLKSARKHANQLGVSFHVGSQCMHPNAYKIAIRMAGEVIAQAGVNVEYFNVGGGFPSIYPGLTPPSLIDYFSVIHQEFEKINPNQSMKLLCEPGRALVAESTSLIVRVELRKRETLYINDGTYGALFDAGTPGFMFPCKLLRNNISDAAHHLPYSFYGPTCDTLDYMKGPFCLPDDIKEGDFIEIGQIGAYGKTMRTNFNGFGHTEQIYVVSDGPLMTMYEDAHVSEEPLEIIAA